MNKLIRHLSFILLFSTILLNAQTTKKEVLSDIKYVGGLYCPYIYDSSATTPAPEGYKPFYLSHYGRHGSRWVNHTEYHSTPLKILNEADSLNKLTSLGQSLFEKMKKVSEDARDRYGDLAPLGVVEEKDIAERMFKSFPEVFSTDNDRICYIYGRSTQVPRCILSMAANNERLKELNPEIETIREATKRNRYLNNDGNINKDTAWIISTNFLKTHFNTSRFIASVFADTLYAKHHIEDQEYFAYLVFASAINIPNLPYLGISMFDVFTDEDLFVLWQASNMYMYYRVGPSPVNGEIAMQSADLLLKDIINCADNAIKNRNVSADLRFGHDTYIIPLLALMDIKDMNVKESDPEKVYQAWANFKASPMGANLQIIFYSNDKTDDILVKFLRNEEETRIPVKTNIAPYYHWKDVKAYYEKKMEG